MIRSLKKCFKVMASSSAGFLDFTETLLGIWFRSKSGEGKAGTLPGIWFRSKSGEGKAGTLPGIWFRSKSREDKTDVLARMWYRSTSEDFFSDLYFDRVESEKVLFKLKQASK